MNAFRQIFFVFTVSVMFFSQLALAEKMHHADKMLNITSGWSPAAAPVAPARVGYLSIDNPSDKAVSIVSATSPLFNQVGFHETLTVDGISTMKPIGVVTIQPRQKVILEPGGMHLMLMNASPDLADSSSIPLVLKLDNGQMIDFKLIVKSKKAIEKSAMKYSGHAHH